MEAIANLWAGRAGLAKTYWGWGILGGVLWGIALSFVTPGSIPAILAVLALTAYYVVVNTGVWRAASQYKGLVVWAGLAKVAAALGFLTIAALVLTLVFVAGDAARQVGKPPPQQPPAPKAIDWEKGVMTPPTTQPVFDKEGKPCTEVTEFLGECKRQP